MIATRLKDRVPGLSGLRDDVLEATARAFAADPSLLKDSMERPARSGQGTATHPLGLFAELGRAVFVFGPVVPQALAKVARGLIGQGDSQKLGEELKGIFTATAKAEGAQVQGLMKAFKNMDQSAVLGLPFGLSWIFLAAFRRQDRNTALTTAAAGLMLTISVLAQANRSWLLASILLGTSGLVLQHKATDAQRSLRLAPAS